MRVLPGETVIVWEQANTETINLKNTEEYIYLSAILFTTYKEKNEGYYWNRLEFG